MSKMRMRSVRRTEAGTTLISIERAGKVIEVDRAGKIIWTFEAARRRKAAALSGPPAR